MKGFKIQVPYTLHTRILVRIHQHKKFDQNRYSSDKLGAFRIIDEVACETIKKLLGKKEDNWSLAICPTFYNSKNDSLSQKLTCPIDTTDIPHRHE